MKLNSLHLVLFTIILALLLTGCSSLATTQPLAPTLEPATPTLVPVEQRGGHGGSSHERADMACKSRFGGAVFGNHAWSHFSGTADRTRMIW